MAPRTVPKKHRHSVCMLCSCVCAWVGSYSGTGAGGRHPASSDLGSGNSPEVTCVCISFGSTGEHDCPMRWMEAFQGSDRQRVRDERGGGRSQDLFLLVPPCCIAAVRPVCHLRSQPKPPLGLQNVSDLACSQALLGSGLNLGVERHVLVVGALLSAGKPPITDDSSACPFCTPEVCGVSCGSGDGTSKCR
jgi:hypothetical protein